MSYRHRLTGITAILITFTVLTGTPDLLATTYYVSPTGNDGNDGYSIGGAWQHVQTACGALQAGDTVFIRGGYWHNGTVYAGDTTGQDYDSVFYYDEESPY
jgi:hypothetical protein